jgi:PAS domain S-box-containing protein
VELEMQNEELRRSRLEIERSHVRYVDLYEFAPVGYLTLTPAGIITGANLTTATLLRVDRAILIGRSLAGFTDGEEADRWNRCLRALVRAGEPQSCDVLLRPTEGNAIRAHLSCQFRSLEGSEQEVRVVLVDVSERWAAEAETRERDAQLRAFFDSPAVGIAITSPEKRWLRVNDHLCSMLGYSRDELLSRTWLELTHPGDAATNVVEFDRMMTGEIDRFSLDKRFICKDGTLLWALLSVSCVRRPDRRVDYLVSIFKDIGKRKEAEAALQRSEEQLARALEGSSDGFWDIDVKGRRVLVSARYNQIIGRPPEMANVPLDELIGIIEPEDQAQIRVDMAALRSGEQDRFAWEYRVRVPGKGLRWVQSRGKVAERDPAGVAARISGTLTDIHERKSYEWSLRESEARFRLLANETPIGIFQANAEGAPIFVNRTLLAMTGTSEHDVHGPSAFDVIHPEDRERALRAWRNAVSRGNPYSDEYRFLTPAGRIVWVRAIGKPVRDESGALTGFVGALVDVTEPRALQLQLSIASRLAALGTLVAGVAHELNNPLAATLAEQGVGIEITREVQAHLRQDAALDRVEESRRLDEVVDALREAQESGQRIARIVRDLTTYGRPDSGRARTRLVDVMEGASRWLPAFVRAAATLQVEDAGAPEVVVAKGQMEQVVVNLVTNAAHATPPGRHGAITVRVGPGAPGMARLEVVDQGVGMEPSLLERIFDPFFTTRVTGKGMGLGLAICQSIVVSHGGTLTVQSEVGKGSTFRVELPAAPADA